MSSNFQRRAARLPAFRLVTGNPSKVEEARRILGFAPETVDVDLPEIQSLDLIEVLRAKAEAASRHVEGPFVVEETGLELSCLNGFPGPLIKWMLAAISSEGVAGLAQRMGDPHATARCALYFCTHRGDRVDRDGLLFADDVVVEGVCPGQLRLPPRGEGGFGWDPVFWPEGLEGSSAELGDEIKDRSGHRGLAWRALVDRLCPPTAPGASSH